MSKDDGGPAFPGGFSETDQDDNVRPFNSGMTLRQYAAIKLRVPNSGTDWLDEMICTSLRDEIAAKAMQSLIQGCNWSHFTGTDDELIATWAESSYILADAMLEARTK